MQVISSALKAALLDIDARVTPRVLVDLFEFYESDYVPGDDGPDPDDAIEKFAAQEITWNGNAYRRELRGMADGGPRSAINRNMGEKTNSVTLNFSNISRYMATLAQSQTIEGLILVIRCVVPSVTDDSLVLFVGRCDKPSDIDKKQFSLSARQDFGNINQTIPPSKFDAQDPEGRLPSDPLFEGIPFIAIAGSQTHPQVVPSTSILGRLLGRRRTIQVTEQWSSVDGTPYGQVIPELFGRCQMQLIPFSWVDVGWAIRYLMAISRGPIDSVTQLKSRTEEIPDPFAISIHLGDEGGAGTNLQNNSPLGGGRYYSHLAYIDAASLSPSDRTDAAPEITALIRGRKVLTPDSDGDYTILQWSNNPVHIARFILTDPQFVNINSGFMEDSVNYLTGLHCDEPLIDESDTQVIVIPSADLPQAGVSFERVLSSNVISPRYFLFNEFGDVSVIPEFVGGPYVGINTGDPVPDPSDPSDPTFLEQNPLLKRYTFNGPITGEVRAVDYLYKTVFPSFKGFLKVNKKGRYEIKSEVPSDATRLRSATAVGATSIPILDVTPWKSGDLLQGRLLLGFGQLTAEVRDVSSADYSTSGNSITLSTSVTGTVTATASGATLSGGSTSVQASGTVTIGGTPALGDTVTVTIDGVAVTYIIGSDETIGTVALMLTNYINATPRLRPYIRASWASGSPTVITIKCLHGALNVSSAYLKAHGGPVADPTVAPTVAAASSGTLKAGTYNVAYANGNSIGFTSLTLVSSVVVSADGKINVSGLPALPAGITSRVFYLSEKEDSTNLRFVATRTDAADFSITAAPLPSAAIPPSYNTTAEEAIRVAMSFATNSQDVFPAWRASLIVTLNDVYLPTVPNGHKYQVTTAGTTGTSEPSWPTSVGGTVASGTAVFTEIGSTVLQQAGLTRANIKKDGFKWPLGSRQSSVNQVKGSYRSSKDDFALIPYRVNDPIHQAQVKKIYPMEFDGSGIDNFNQFFRIANWLLAKNREGDWFNEIDCGPAALILEEGDVICASDDSGGLINAVTRIEDLSIHPNHDVTINQSRKYSTLMFSDDVGAQAIPIASSLRYVQTVDSLIEFIDTVAIREADKTRSGFYVSVSRDLDIEGDWRGFTLYVDYGDGYVPVASGDVPGLFGESTDTLGTASTTVLDTSGDLTFTLKYAPDTPPFSTVTEADLIANPYRNLFLVGNEYIQAATIVDNGNRSFTISDLLHGRFDTDCVSHSVGERVIYIDGSEVFVPTDPSRIGIEYNYKAVTVNQDVADATAVPFTWQGNIFRAAKPTDLAAVWDASGNIHASMVDHPTLLEMPDTCIMRFRRFSDGVLMRDIPMDGRSATSFGAVFSDVSGDVTVENNNVYANGAASTFGLARTSQIITETGSFVEATIAHDDSVDPSTHSVFVAVDLLSPDEEPWDDLLAALKYRFVMGSGGNPERTNATYILYDYDGSFTEISDGTLLLPAKIRIAFVGTQVRYYVDWVNANSKPIAVGVSPVQFPLKVRVVVFSGNRILNMRIGGLSDPQTIYSVDQQTKDNEDNGGTGPLADITIEGWQVSPLVSDLKGIPTKVTRFTQ